MVRCVKGIEHRAWSMGPEEKGNRHALCAMRFGANKVSRNSDGPRTTDYDLEKKEYREHLVPERNILD